MNFVGDLVALAEETEIADLKQQVPVLKREVHSFKNEVIEFFERIYVKFLQISTSDEKFVATLARLQEKLDVSKKTLAGIRRIPIQDEANLKKHLQESSDILDEIGTAYKVHELLLDSERYYSTEDYAECLEKFKNLNDVMSRIDAKHSIMLKYFRKHAAFFRTDIFRHFGELIKKKYKISLKEQCYASVEIDPNIHVDDLVQSLLSFNYHIDALTDIIEFLYKYILFPIVTSTCKVSVKDNEITVKIIKINVRQNFSDVFKHFNYLSFFFQIHSKSGTLSFICNELKDRLTSLIITQCLDQIEPSKYGQVVNYEKIYHETEFLESDLDSVNLISLGSLTKYVKKLHEIHVDKLCEMFIHNAITIIEGKNELCSIPDNELKFGAISRNIQDFLELIEGEFLEMKKETNDLKRFQAILSALDYYKTAYKYKNKKDPEKVALFHNNCQYIANEIGKWNVLYFDILCKEGKLPLFKDEAFHFQIIGQEVFNNFVQEQISNIESMLINNFVVTEQGSKVIVDISEESLTKYFSILKNLKDIWHDLLRQELLNKTMGVLFNVICEIFLKSMLQCESLKNITVEKLRKISGLIVLNISTYSKKSTDLKCIKCWNKFIALNFLLNKNLNEIHTDLINKNSILKSNFKSCEIDILIKALFESCDVREIVLGKIYD